MEIRVDNQLTIGDLIKLEEVNVLRVNREYQRGLRWTDMQKRMFIDSIFRGYSIPAFYFHEVTTEAGTIQNTYFEIVDGQQRVNAIYSFSEDAFALLNPTEDSSFRFPNFVRKYPCPWGGKRFSELSADLQRQLLEHKVVVYQITTDDENLIRDLFIRLQGGTPLTPQDKRDSWPGKFTEYVLKVGGKSGVDRWYGFSVFKEVAKVSNESKRRQLAAQVFMLFWTKRNEVKFCDIKSSNIDDFYHAQVDFDEKSDEAKQFEKICGVLYEAFRGKPKIYGHYLIHSFLFVDALLDEYAPGWESRYAGKVFEFDTNRQNAAKAIKNKQEPENPRYYNDYGRLTQTQSDNESTIKRRHAFFVEEMLKLLSPTKKDPTRNFSDLERQAIFFRDMEGCQWCRMKGVDHKVLWTECEVHHVMPHSKGGQTEIQNGALVHSGCHPKAEYDVELFKEWWSGLGLENESDDHSNTLPPDGTSVKFSYRGTDYFGEISNRTLVLTEDGKFEGLSCTSFSAASRKITNTSRNGWRDWELRLPRSNNWILADDWRNDAGTQAQGGEVRQTYA